MNFLYEDIELDDNMVSYYDELPLWSSPFGIFLLHNIPLIKESTIVDIGCGTGFPLFELAQRLGATCMVYGIEPWEQAVDRAEKKKEQYNLDNVEIIKSYADDMPFEDGIIDMVVSNLGINNFDNPQKVVQECHRILKPGGKLVFTTNLRGHFQEFYAIFAEVLFELKLEKEIENLNRHIMKRCSIEDLKGITINNNFRINKIYQDNYIMRFLDGSAFFEHYFIKLAFLQELKEIIDEQYWEEVFSNIESRLNYIAERNQQVAFTVPMAYVECEKIDENFKSFPNELQVTPPRYH